MEADIVGSFVGGLGVEAFVAAARVMHYKNRWSRHREASIYLRKQFTPSADRIALNLSSRLARARLSNAQQSEIAALLRRPEGKALLRQLMLVCLTGQEDQYSEDLVAQFTSLIALFTGLSRESAETVGHILHEEFTKASQELIPLVADDEDALALFRDEAWNQLLLESLRNISQTTDLYTSFSPAQLRSFEEFERTYRTQVRARHKFITPPHLDYVQRVLINKLFVQPNLERIDANSQDEIANRSTDNQQQTRRVQPVCARSSASFSDGVM